MQRWKGQFLESRSFGEWIATQNGESAKLVGAGRLENNTKKN